MSLYSIQAKLVLLTLTFPRVRIIWSSSPYATAAIFDDLKQHNFEPDAAKAIAATNDPEGDLNLTSVPTILNSGGAFNVVPGSGELIGDLRARSAEAFDAGWVQSL